MTYHFSRGDTPLQLKMDLDEENSNEKTILNFLQSGNFYEPDVSNILVKVLGEGDVVLDIGANVGFFTVLAARLVGPAGHVVAFEPDAANLARLRGNLVLNDIANVTVVEKAATNQEGQVRFFINSDNSGGNALWDPGQFPGNAKSLASPVSLAVAATTLDAECARLRLRAPKLIKIDTEGADQLVLEGARALLARRTTPFVIAELHEFGLAKMGCSQQSLRGLMEGFGYATFALSYGGALPKLVPPATRIEARLFINLLFSTPERVGEYWPTTFIDPRDPR
jgi:FkbM family methyltransferase